MVTKQGKGVYLVFGTLGMFTVLVGPKEGFSEVHGYFPSFLGRQQEIFFWFSCLLTSLSFPSHMSLLPLLRESN